VISARSAIPTRRIPRISGPDLADRNFLVHYYWQAYYNQTMARPFKWTYQGKALSD